MHAESVCTIRAYIVTGERVCTRRKFVESEYFDEKIHVAENIHCASRGETRKTFEDTRKWEQKKKCEKKYVFVSARGDGTPGNVIENRCPHGGSRAFARVPFRASRAVQRVTRPERAPQRRERSAPFAVAVRVRGQLPLRRDDATTGCADYRFGRTRNRKRVFVATTRRV